MNASATSDNASVL